MMIATCTGSLEKNPGSKIHVSNCCIGSARVDDDVGFMGREVGVLLSRNHEDPPVDAEHVDVMPVEAGENVGADHLIGGAADRSAAGDVDDAIHDRQERVQ